MAKSTIGLNTSGKSRKHDTILEYLPVLDDFQGLVVTEEVAENLFYTLISLREKGYNPTFLKSYKPELETLSYEEVKEIMDEKYRVDKKYMKPLSRLETLFISLKRLGFCEFKKGEIIRLTELGCQMLKNFNIYNDINSSIDDRNEAKRRLICLYRNCFSKLVQEDDENLFSKFCTLNNKVIVPFLLAVIKELGYVGHRDLIVVSFWPNNNVISCCNKIRQLRGEKEKYTLEGVVNEMISFLDIDRNLVFKKAKNPNKQREKDKETINNIPAVFYNNYFDFLNFAEWIYKDDKGHLILNENEMDSINYVIDKYSNLVDEVDSWEEYKKIMGRIDQNLMEKPVSMYSDNDKFNKQCDTWTFEELFLEAERINGKKGLERNNKFEASLKDFEIAEFVFPALLNKVIFNDNVMPNFSISEKGMIVGHAGAFKPDSVVLSYNRDMLLEVTLSTDKGYLRRKEWPGVSSHLEDYEISRKNDKEPTFSLFIIPKRLEDIDYNFSREIYNYVKDSETVNKIIPITISEFLIFVKKIKDKRYTVDDIFNDLSIPYIINDFKFA